MRKLPNKFDDLTEDLLSGFRKSQEILEPIIHFTRNQDNKINAQLGALSKSKVGTEFFSANSNDYDWVLINKIIYPLPLDISNHILDLDIPFDGTIISYKHFIKLYQKPSDLIAFSFSDDIFSSGTIQSNLGCECPKDDNLKADLYRYQSLGVNWMNNILDDSAL